MCTRYSFLLTKTGKILDGRGLTESHSTMATLNGVNQDDCNAYEWQPPEGWPDAEPLAGLTKDLETFVPKASHLKRIAAHVTARYPDMAAWDAADAVDSTLHQQTVTLDGREMLILLKPGVYAVSEGTVEAFGSATVRAYGSATVRAYGSATVEAFGSDTVEAFDSATVEAYGSATVIKPHLSWGNDATVTVQDKGLLVDRSGNVIRVVCAEPVEVVTA